MDVEAASLEQVRLARNGRVVVFTAAESQVAADLDRLGGLANTTFVLRWHEETEHWSIVQRHGPEDETFVCSTRRTEKLPVLVEQLERKINREWDLAAELDAHDDRVDAEKDHRFEELVGDIAQRGWHELRKRDGVKDRIFVPRAA